MTYSAMTAKDTGDLITEAEWDKIKENFDHIAAMLFGTSALSAITAGAQLSIVTGEYTGDGAATKAISGIGFLPRRVDIIPQIDGSSALHIKTDQEGTMAFVNGQYEADHIISLDADGFTVGDGTGGTGGNSANVNLRVYTYIAWR